MDLLYWPNLKLYKSMKMIVTLEIATYVGGSVIHCTFRKLSLVSYIFLLSLKTQNDLYVVYTVVSNPSLFYSLNV